MAACGLSPGRNGSIGSVAVGQQLSDEEDDEDGYGGAPINADGGRRNSRASGQNAKTLARFAAAMMRELKDIPLSKYDCGRREPPKFQLRIGLCCGEVIAGVVGAQKPLYDIWSDTVNVASRMDSRGVAGKIQVPEATSVMLRNSNVSSTLRGVIEVKGKPDMRTHFVDLDEKMHLVPIDKDAETDVEDNNLRYGRKYGFGLCET